MVLYLSERALRGQRIELLAQLRKFILTFAALFVRVTGAVAQKTRRIERISFHLFAEKVASIFLAIIDYFHISIVIMPVGFIRVLPLCVLIETDVARSAPGHGGEATASGVGMRTARLGAGLMHLAVRVEIGAV